MNEFQDLLHREYLDKAVFELSERDIEPLKLFIEHGIMPGSFLEAVLRNDLKEAMGRADVFNRRKVFEYVQWLYNKAPSDCWGSNDKVDAWLNERENEKV
ncbi:MAG TPA: hypothetical protein P5270_09905 [Victivallales bacterium]|nr:hypothetical protein [Victivallales bacterium]